MNERPSKLTTQEFIRAARAVQKIDKGKFGLGNDKQGYVRITKAGMKKDIVVTIHSKDLTERPFVEETSVHVEPGRRPRYSLTYETREPGIDSSLSLTFEDGEVSDEVVKFQTEILAKEVVGPEEKTPDERFVESVKEEVDRLFEISEQNHMLTSIQSVENGNPLLLHRASFVLDAQRHVNIDYAISGSLEDPHHEMTVSLVAENGSEAEEPYHLDYTQKALSRIIRFEQKEMFFDTSPEEEKEFLEFLKSLGGEPRFPQ